VASTVGPAARWSVVAVDLGHTELRGTVSDVAFLCCVVLALGCSAHLHTTDCPGRRIPESASTEHEHVPIDTTAVPATG
jgi:hypothetical protein